MGSRLGDGMRTLAATISVMDEAILLMSKLVFIPTHKGFFVDLNHRGFKENAFFTNLKEAAGHEEL
jgi:hypothetical protein